MNDDTAAIQAAIDAAALAGGLVQLRENVRREQIRRDAMTSPLGDLQTEKLARHCLALLAELEQAEKACNICAVAWPNHHENCAYVATARDLEQAERERRRVPGDEGGPGHEETYWLRAKLNAAVTHLRDIEDFYRLRGGTDDSPNMVRADRARQLYEAILEDFTNGKLTRPSQRERLQAAEARLAKVPALVEALKLIASGQLVTEAISEPMPDMIDGSKALVTYHHGKEPAQIARDALATREQT